MILFFFTLGWIYDLTKVEVTFRGSDIIDGKPKRRKGRSDYLLCLPVLEEHPPLPVAVLEAKKENSSATPGLQQVQNYAKRFNVPFAFSTNGKLFSGFGADTGLISYEKPLGQFPAPVDLLNRYQRRKSKGRRYRIFFEVAVR